jgi:hypothetical protein
MHSPSIEWLPASLAPPDKDLEVCVLDLDGMVRALSFPCHKEGAEWVDASGKRQSGIQPMLWRGWS